MKKITLSLSFLTTLLQLTTAQTSTVSKLTDIKIGLKAGINFSNVYDSKGEEFKADGKFGFAGGAFAYIPLGKIVGIQPEILFSQKGFTATGKILGSPYSFTRTTNYVDIPILFAVKASTYVTILAGPQYAYLIKQTDVFKNSFTTVQQQQEFEKDNIRQNTLCFVGGIDINITNVVINTRVGWDIQNNNGDGTSTTPRYKNVWYQLTAGIRF